jgi:hypothetical protein
MSATFKMLKDKLLSGIVTLSVLLIMGLITGGASLIWYNITGNAAEIKDNSRTLRTVVELQVETAVILQTVAKDNDDQEQRLRVLERKIRGTSVQDEN